MMKRVFSVILSVMLLLSAAGCQSVSGPAPATQTPQGDVWLTRTDTPSVYGGETPGANDAWLPDGMQGTQLAAKSQPAPANEMRGIWLSYRSFEPMLKNQSEAQFTKNIDTAFKQVSDFGFNTVFTQVRPFGDAYYNSDYFPWSARITGTEGKNPGFDPLTILCKTADKYNLRIEAWLNPYRVRTDSEPMAEGNQAKKWIAAENDAALEWNGGVYYNPGSAKARELIINGVKEIVTNYDVDGVHFDDYFYPTTDPAFDQATYQASGSKLSQADWRRENVNTLLRDVYAAVKAIKPGCVFGVSPQGNLKINYESQYADVATWLKTPGYVDYILPQVYYGYKNGTCPYTETVQTWDKLIVADGIQFYVGLAAYKVGATDQWAGDGKDEWMNSKSLLAQMVQTARNQSNYAGVALFSYEGMFVQPTKQMQTERANLKKLFT